MEPAFSTMLCDRVALLRPLRDSSGRAVPAGTLGRVAGRDAQAGTIDVRFDGAAVQTVAIDAIAPLRIDGALPRNGQLALMLCTIVGSRAHGLETEQSDLDRRGFFLPAASRDWSLDGVPEQLVHDADQLCFWEVGKFVRLALKANPTVLEALYSPCIELVSPLVAAPLERLKQGGALLSKRAHQSFLGYADAQFAKMQRARERGGTMKWQHAMHLIRLLHAGIDLVATGRLDVTVPPERREQLLAIKRGELAWDEVTALRGVLVRRFEAAFASTPLPDEPDLAAANAFVVELRAAAAAQESAS